MEDDGTLGHEVFASLKKRFRDVDRAKDLMGAMSALGMVYFESIEAATEDLIARDLRMSVEEAALINDAGREAVARLEHKDCEMVMVARSTQARNARMSNTPEKGGKATARHALANASTLKQALYIKSSERKPKPRNCGMVDEALWEGAVITARQRLMNSHVITDLDAYYITMCELGKSLLVAEIYREAQGLYDYRAEKLRYRSKRKAKA